MVVLWWRHGSYCGGDMGRLVVEPWLLLHLGFERKRGNHWGLPVLAPVENGRWSRAELDGQLHSLGVN